MDIVVGLDIVVGVDIVAGVAGEVEGGMGEEVVAVRIVVRIVRLPWLLLQGNCIFGE